MTTCLLILSDGRCDYLRRTLESAKTMLPGFDQYVLIDDAPRERTLETFRAAGFPMPPAIDSMHGSGNHGLGFAGAIQEGWARVRTDYVLHLEQDFTFIRPVPVGEMVEVLHEHAYLAQIALLRQPWNEEERAAGGVVRLHPADFLQREWRGYQWMEHRRFWTTNPSVYSSRICGRGWPSGPESEGRFALALFASDPSFRSAYWGAGEEWVEHIGVVRTGTRY